MLKLDRTPLHWKTAKLIGARLSEVGLHWAPPSRCSWYGFPPVKVRRKLSRAFLDRYGVTIWQAASALRRNYRWHEAHPGRGGIRHGDIPF